MDILGNNFDKQLKVRINNFNGSMLCITSGIHNNVIFSKKIEEFLGLYIILLHPEIRLVIIN